MIKWLYNSFYFGIIVFIYTSCTDSLPSQRFNSDSQGANYLYVASGNCYAGVTPAVPVGSGTVARFNLKTGAYAGTLVDYTINGFGDQPVAIRHFHDDQFLVAIENASGRRIDIINRDGTGRTTYLNNSTALNSVLRDLFVLPDLSILITKSSGMEKFNFSKARITKGAASYIANPGGSCATSTALMAATAVLPNGLIAYAHATSPNNKIGIIKENGYSTPADCLDAKPAPIGTALPTSIAYHQLQNKILVGYGSNTPTSNVIYSYDIDLNTGILSNETLAYNDSTFLSAPSEIAIDQATGTVYIANGATAFSNIEKFNLEASGELIKDDAPTFIAPSLYTRCISGLEVAP